MRIFKLFIPSFDELSLFLMSAAFLVLYIADPTLRTESYERVLSGFHVWILVLLALFVAGLVFSIYHVFTAKEKSYPAKCLMLYFAVMANYVSGLAAAVYIIQHESLGWLIVFPVWNMLGGVVLLFMGGFGVIDEAYISDEDVRPPHALVGLFFLCLILGICQFYFHMYWAITFSICVGYATTLSRTVQWLCGLAARSD